MSVLRSSSFAVLFVSTLVACVDEDRGPRWRDRAPVPSVSDSPAAAPAPTTSSAVSPMLVEVDTDQTMDAVGGEGVGVFVEYGKGGHWHLWWSCDTNRTAQSCDFKVTAVANSGALSKLDTSEVHDGSAAADGTTGIVATTTSTTGVNGMRFESDPGAIVTVSASVGSLQDGSFLFFVQDGKVNGGFAGKLTNPLQFQGNTP
jgi:hypothetical protein